jgi:metal-responsive CopG/Arc/MetJ family transcriptional regulator
LARAAQLSVSLPAHLVAWLDEKAKHQNASRSSVLAQELEARRQQEWVELFAAGCREMTDEMQDAAEETFAAQAELALREPFDAD